VTVIRAALLEVWNAGDGFRSGFTLNSEEGVIDAGCFDESEGFLLVNLYNISSLGGYPSHIIFRP